MSEFAHLGLGEVGVKGLEHAGQPQGPERVAQGWSSRSPVGLLGVGAATAFRLVVYAYRRGLVIWCGPHSGRPCGIKVVTWAYG
ncbi:hypothetical protein AB0950_39820 [Streptomyces sp. NPDC007189]|uniref:hypothetical protein n=1 Tax=Streptomyces sp. NPDC007189 TaxID=3154315 RepID=UPI003452B4E6